MCEIHTWKNVHIKTCSLCLTRLRARPRVQTARMPARPPACLSVYPGTNLIKLLLYMYTLFMFKSAM